MLTDRIRFVKIALWGAALVIAAASLLVSNALVRDLKHEERQKMEVWAEAMRSLIRADERADLNLVLRVINGNGSIPVAVFDNSGILLDHRNLPVAAGDSLAIDREARRMLREGHRMHMYTDAAGRAAPQSRITICYSESLMLRRLAAFPYVQLGVVGLFIAVAIYALLSSKRAEQNKVWVGLSRETAHQLGTPISSLLAWTEIIAESHPDDPLLPDMRRDVERLQLIAERFSKIGSAPELRSENLCAVLDDAVGYIARRASDNVHLTTSYPAPQVPCRLNAPLFEWVIENLCKNAIDAMAQRGEISIYVCRSGRNLRIEVSDTGRGIPRAQWRTVFRPGFTTKQRGWGLGLSLARRIIEEYHRGHIFVARSEPGRGTTFCIELPAGA